MASPDLQRQIDALNPEELRIFKQELARIQSSGVRVETSMSKIPELSDITGNRQIPISQLSPESQRNQNPWLGAISKVTAPLRWVEENVEKPIAAAVSSPFTPSVPGTENLPWLQRERAEYEQWEEPTLMTTPWGYKVRPTKGMLQTLPWLAVPSAGAVAGRLGKVASAGGKLAGAAAVGEKVLRPAVVAENLMNPFAWKSGLESFAASKVGRIEGITPETFQQIVQGIKSKFPRMSDKKVTKLAYEEAAKIPGVKIMGEKKTVLPIATEVMPEGFDAYQQDSLSKLIELVKAFKPVRGATERLRSMETGKRFGEFRKEIKLGSQKGLGAEEIGIKAASKMEGKYPVAPTPEEVSSIAAGISKEARESLFGVIINGHYTKDSDRLNTLHALWSLFDGSIPQRAQLSLLEKTFGSELISEILKKRSGWDRFREAALDLANAPRMLLSSFDLSGLLRQGGVLFTANPAEGVKSVAPMVRALMSEKNEILYDQIIKSRPHSALAEAYGLYFAPRTGLVSPTLSEQEEAFMSKIIGKYIPGVRASNRAYVMGLNDIRSNVWEKLITKWESQGRVLVEQDYKDLAKFINWASGRGTLPEFLNRQGTMINALLFAPKLLVSRAELPFTVLPMVTKSDLVRREAWRTLMTDVGTGASILTAAKLSGVADIELDPRSSDFGKMIVGNQRVDIWTGYAQYMRLAAQVATEQHKSESGMITKMPRKEAIDRFFESKLSPAAGFLNDLMKGETYLGEALPPKSVSSAVGQMWQRVGPIAIQEMVQGIQDSALTGAAVSGLGFLGVGVTTYTDTLGRVREKEARAKYGMGWDELGLKLGRAEQLKLEQTSDRIIKVEKENETRYATGSPSVTKRFHDEGRQIEEHYRKLVNQAAELFRKTGDGVEFREYIDAANNYRRQRYDERNNKSEFRDIMSFYNQPLTPEQETKTNPGDLARREYYQTMFAPDMTVDGKYDFEEAERRERVFLDKYGQRALDYIEDYQSSRWLDKPVELKSLEVAKKILKPYWDVADQIWSLYPRGLREISDQIDLMNRNNPGSGDLILRRYPQILRAREIIAREKKRLREGNPQIESVYRTFYGR